MCGICGFISTRQITKKQLKRMNDTMVHRGPDDSGEEIFPAAFGYQVGLAQRRLSILDLSGLGHQPMHSQGFCGAPDGSISIVYNGEIYNFQELKKELSDYPFRSTCDTEVILAAYLKWGISCVERFNGMFAIALYDRRRQAVYLIRDRIGKKPLCYWLDGENLVFASELKPIMACPGFSGRIRGEVLSRFLFQQYINAPDTIFENVYKVEPGGILRFSLDPDAAYAADAPEYAENVTRQERGNGRRVRKWKYWDIKKVYRECASEPVTDYGQAKEELKALLKKAVASRMIADVPLGSFLSGGYDSSLVTAIAQECAGAPVKTFSIGFAEERYNEAKYAKAVAEYLGTDHTELIIDEAEMFRLVESIPQYYDEPFADSSQIATMLVSQLARQQVTVALSGDGGDEFYCGYNLYEKVARAGKLDFAGSLVNGFCHLPGIRQAGLFEKLPFQVRVIAGNRDPETKTQLASPDYITAAERMIRGEGMNCRYPVESGYGVDNWQIRRMLLDMDTYLPGDILCKVDRASMKYSLETRCPILDRDVMEYSFRLPHSFKYENGIKKRILKDIAYDYIPRELLDRPKVGFAVPLDKWLRGPLREQLLSYADRDFLVRQGIFDADYVTGLMERYLKTGDGGPSTGANFSKVTWSFFIFQQWYCQQYQRGYEGEK